MTCSTCGVAGHNARGCEKFNKMSSQGTSKSEKLNGRKQCNGKQPMKRQRKLIDVEDRDEEPPKSLDATAVEHLPLSDPQPSQKNQLSHPGQAVFMPTPKVQPGQSFFGPSSSNPNFVYPMFDEEFEEDLPWRSRGVSELKSKLQERQK